MKRPDLIPFTVDEINDLIFALDHCRWHSLFAQPRKDRLAALEDRFRKAQPTIAYWDNANQRKHK